MSARSEELAETQHWCMVLNQVIGNCESHYRFGACLRTCIGRTTGSCVLRSRTSTILLPVVCWQQVLAVEAGGRVGLVCGPTQEELLVD